MGDPVPRPDLADRRRQQAELYGAPVDELVDSIRRHVGLDPPEIARTIGVSRPMFAQVESGQRVRIGNPAAIGRLAQLRDFTRHLAAGEASSDDIALTLAQIRASTGVVPAAPSATSQRPDPGNVPGPTALTRQALTEATGRVHQHLRATPAQRWPLLERFTQTETWVKHENHHPTGAFKVRGGVNFVARLLEERATPAGLVSATRGNHGQSLAFAGRAYGVAVTIVVPEGNSPDKNRAMEGYGAELVVHGDDFQASREYAERLAAERGLDLVPSYHPWLVEGVATYAAELHASVPDLDVVYVPVGMGSGICANIAVRDLLGAPTRIVGVVCDLAPAYALSFDAGSVVTTRTAGTFVDGVACRVPDERAVEIINAGAERIVRVSEARAAEAMAMMYRATHNLAEPAGSLALAGLLADRERVSGQKVAVVHTGGNADFDILQRVMKEHS